MARAPSRATGRRRIVVALTALASSVLVAIAATAIPTAAAGEHHAGVVVDTGSGVHVEIVTFTEDSISGLEALQRAGTDPSVLGFSGIGGAVCSLYGVGHPATSSTCLGEPSDPRYWAYWHVPRGQSGFDESTYSRAGAGAVRVHDGDVEGWRFGTGEPPAWQAISFPQPLPPADASAGPTGLPGGGSAGGGGSAEAGGAQTGPSSAAPTTSSTLSRGAWAAIAALKAASSTTSSTTSTTRPGGTKGGKHPGTEVAAKRASATHDSGGGGGSVVSFAAFAAVLLLLAAGVHFARRARIGRSAGPS